MKLNPKNVCNYYWRKDWALKPNLALTHGRKIATDVLDMLIKDNCYLIDYRVFYSSLITELLL